jgi:hypothetical protein
MVMLWILKPKTKIMKRTEGVGYEFKTTPPIDQN